MAPNGLVERTGWAIAPGVMIALVADRGAAGVADDARDRSELDPNPSAIVLISSGIEDQDVEPAARNI